MKTMFLEIRDRSTRIGVLATVFEPSGENPEEQKVNETFLGFYGLALEFPIVMVTRLDENKSEFFWNNWPGRTMPAAHRHISANWKNLVSGQVVDVRVILGEEDTAAAPEIVRA